MRIKEIWRELEVARAELRLMDNMMIHEVSVPQVSSIVGKMGRARKSNRWGGRRGDHRIATDLMRSKVDDARQHLKETHTKLRKEKEKMKNKYNMEDKKIKKIEDKAKK